MVMNLHLMKSIYVFLFLLGSVDLHASLNTSFGPTGLGFMPSRLSIHSSDSEDVSVNNDAIDTLYIQLKSQKIVKLYRGMKIKARSRFELASGTIHEIYTSYLVVEDYGYYYTVNYTNLTTLKIMHPKVGVRVLGGFVTALAYPVGIIVAVSYPGDLETIEIAGATGIAAGLGMMYVGSRIRGKRIFFKHATILTEL